MFRIRVADICTPPCFITSWREESITSDDTEFMLRSKGRSSAINTYNFFFKMNSVKITFFDDDIFFLLHEPEIFFSCNISLNRPASLLFRKLCLICNKTVASLCYLVKVPPTNKCQRVQKHGGEGVSVSTLSDVGSHLFRRKSLRNMLTSSRKVSYCISSFCEVIFFLFNDHTR